MVIVSLCGVISDGDVGLVCITFFLMVYCITPQYHCLPQLSDVGNTLTIFASFWGVVTFLW